MKHIIKTTTLTIILIMGIVAVVAAEDSAVSYFTSANSKQARGDWDGAIADYSRAIELNPDLAVAYYNRSIARNHQGDLDGAIEDYTKTIALNPNQVQIYRVYNARGIAMGKKHKLSQALEDFDKAIELKPDFADAYINRGLTWKALGNTDRATADLNRANKLDPKSTKSAIASNSSWMPKPGTAEASGGTQNGTVERSASKIQAEGWIDTITGEMVSANGVGPNRTQTSSGIRTYYVLRCSNGHDYLLKFDRKMLGFNFKSGRDNIYTIVGKVSGIPTDFPSSDLEMLKLLDTGKDGPAETRDVSQEIIVQSMKKQ